MRLIENMYIVDEYDAFVLPNPSLCFSQIENIVKVVKKFKVSSFFVMRRLFLLNL